MAKKTGNAGELSAADRDAAAKRDAAARADDSATAEPETAPAGTETPPAAPAPDNGTETKTPAFDRAGLSAGDKRAFRLIEVAGFRGDPVSGFSRNFPDGSKLVFERTDAGGYNGTRVGSYGETVGGRNFANIAGLAAAVCAALSEIVPVQS